jgi:hypothetical protein
MLKYGTIRKPIINTLKKEPEAKKSIETYNNNIVADEEKQIYLDYDDYELTDEMLNLVKINPNKTQTLSIEDNKIENILFIEELLEKNKNIKGFWCSGNTFCDVNEGYENEFEKKFPHL